MNLYHMKIVSICQRKWFITNISIKSKTIYEIILWHNCSSTSSVKVYTHSHNAFFNTSIAVKFLDIRLFWQQHDSSLCPFNNDDPHHSQLSFSSNSAMHDLRKFLPILLHSSPRNLSKSNSQSEKVTEEQP